MHRVIGVAFLLTVGLVAGPVAATQQGVDAMKRWKQMDDCARRAQTAYPEYTAEANAKRDATLKACLNGANLPPREPLQR